jgi:cell division protein FtsI/penicillin-binding protein 2
MRRADLQSASGLRPLSAFVVVSGVVLAVVVRVAVLVLSGDVSARELAVAKEHGVEPAYAIDDRNGVPLAIFLDRLELEMSPRAMWQAHTPDYMAAVIADVLGPPFEDGTLLENMLPDAKNGIIEVGAWRLDESAARRVDAWIRGEGEWERDAPGPVPGIGLRPVEGADDGDDAPSYRLTWAPELLLSRETRASHGAGRGPLRWSRHVADAIGDAVLGPLDRSGANAGDEGRRRRRDDVWKALMPSMWCRAAAGVRPDRALPLSDLLATEAVERHQMKLVSARDRQYPAGEFDVLGRWGFVDDGQAQPEACSGLERLCDQLLSGDEWSWIELSPGAYAYRREKPARLALRPYFLGRAEATPPPRVSVTFDVALQRMVRARLEEAMAEHRPAVALAICVEVESGDVLAVDGMYAYPMAAFPPLKHLFMPGSTFKLLTMATALEAGVVHALEEFEVGDGKWALHEDGGTRIISEAEGSKHGRLRAEECLAHSVNAGLVQIGLRIDAGFFHGRLKAMDYGNYPDVGLGGEEPGYVPDLPWKRRFSHASVSYGYEILTTLWQHMQGLCTILRGGRFRELRIARAVDFDGSRYGLDRGAERVVFSRATCDTVRGMMELGARIGTGRDHYRDDIMMGTKTGTAERVASEVCLHVWGRRVEELSEAGRSVTNAEYKRLGGQREEHGTCHTSSMLAFGRLPRDDRELAVLVVMDEPRSDEHFGSRVAGPAAMDILVEALGITRGGQLPTPELVPGFAASPLPSGSTLVDSEREQPWNREVGR